MRDENTIVRERQLAIRREMDRRDISIKAVQYDGGWKNPSTVLSYFPNPEGKAEPATLSVATLYRLLRSAALPVDLLSMLLPDGLRIVGVPEEVDHDEIAAVLHDYLCTKERAHHPESEDGREIGPGEDNVLRCKFAEVKAA